VPVYTLVQPSDKPTNGQLENSADTEKGADGYGAACLDLLPMARRKAKADHVLLAVPLAPAQLADSLAECPKERSLIYHAPVFTGSRAKIPRAD